MSNARTLAGITAQVSQPTDIRTFIEAARADLAGTEYPGALELLKALTDILVAGKRSNRGIRTFHARYILALEGYDDEARENIDYVVEIMGEFDFKS